MSHFVNFIRKSSLVKDENTISSMRHVLICMAHFYFVTIPGMEQTLGTAYHIMQFEAIPLFASVLINQRLHKRL